MFFRRVSLGGALILSLLAGVASADIMWGANGHPLTAYPGVTIEQQMDYLENLGMKSYRVNVPDMGKLADIAELVRLGKARDISILPVITPSDIDLGRDSAEKLYRVSFDLAFALASKFKDEIRVWELGNELENFAIIQPCEQRDDGSQYPCEWGPAGGVDALEYYGPRWRKVSAVLKGLSDGVHAADPAILKAIGTAGWGHLGAFDRMKQDGIRWDISVWHIYGEDPRWAFERLAQFEHPIWITEFNNPYGSQRSEKQQVEGITHMMLRLRELSSRFKVEAAFVYELMDETYWAPDMEAFQGLVRLVNDGNGSWRPGEPKPAYAAVREIIRGPVLSPRPARECKLDAIGQVSAADRVSYSFCLVLGRVPDGRDMQDWITALEADEADRTEMLLAILRSREMIAKYEMSGLTDTEYVKFLYRLFLDREADDVGLATYVFELRTVSRDSVAASILLSSEFRERHPILFAAIDPGYQPVSPDG